MLMLTSIALAASAAAVPHCSWDKPGINPFIGDVVAAIDRYKDIPAPLRAKLKARMEKRDYDEIVTIQRDAIKGQAQYSNEIRDMHFGAGSLCRTVSRVKWTQQAEERGLVYCEDGQCILVPTVCRNVSRIQRLAPRAAAPGAAQNVVSAASEMGDPQAQIDMEPTSAGVLGGGAPGSPTSFAQQAGAGSGFEAGSPGAPAGSFLPGGLGGGSLGPGAGGIFVPSLPPGTITIPSDVAPAIPEPGTWALLMAGLLTLGVVARRRQS